MYISDYYATNRKLGVARQCSEVFGSNRRAACLGGLVRASFRSLDICFAKEYLHRVTSVQIRGIWQHRNIIRYVLLILSEYFSTGFTAVSRGLHICSEGDVNVYVGGEPRLLPTSRASIRGPGPPVQLMLSLPALG